MKKKVIGIMSLVLAGTMITASLTGCGMEAKATEQEIPMEEETIVATSEESSEGTDISVDGEITEKEVVGNAEEDTAKEASYTEHEFFYALDEQDPSTAQEIDMNALEPDGNDFELTESITLYGSGLGRIMGYTKPNINVHVVTSNEDWYCISFADEEPKFQLVLAKAEDFMAASGIYENIPAVSSDDIKLALMDQLSSMEHGVDYDVYYVALDKIVEGMDFVSEFTIPTYCRDVDKWIAQIVADSDFDNYKYFYIEKVEDNSDDENSCFKVTYGELQDFAK